MNQPSAWNWIGPLLLATLYGVASWFFYRWVELVARRRTRRRWTLWHDIVASSLGWPLILLLVLAGLVILFALWPVAPATRAFYLGLQRIIFIVALVLYIQQLFLGLYRASPRGSWMRVALLRRLLLVTLYIVAGLMILDTLGLPMAAPIGAFAIAALACAWAARGVLEDFVAGIRLAIERPFAVGQTIEHATIEPGEVVQIGWLDTWLRTSEGSLVRVPNAHVMGWLTHVHHPAGPGALVYVSLSVSRRADLTRVEQLALDVARRLMPPAAESEDAYGASAEYRDIDSDSAELQIVLRGPTPAAVHAFRSEYVKALHDALAAAGIELS